MSATRVDRPAVSRQTGKRFGYGIAVGINLAMLVVAHNILSWGWLPFLTDEFEEVISWISLSLFVSIAANLIYQLDDSPSVRSAGQIVTNLVSIIATYVLLEVFPFDFSRYAFDWTRMVRILFVLAMVGAGIGVLAEVIKLIVKASEEERSGGMSTASKSGHGDVGPAPPAASQLYRSSSERVVAGVCGGLGEHFRVDPLWFRAGFVVLALGGGSGVLVYLLLWLLLPQVPDGYAPAEPGRGNVTGTAVIGVVFMIVGTIALANTISPWLGQYIWPLVFVLGGLALLLGGLKHDAH